MSEEILWDDQFQGVVMHVDDGTGVKLKVIGMGRLGTVGSGILWGMCMDPEIS
jgi:hypothetical protein